VQILIVTVKFDYNTRGRR